MKLARVQPVAFEDMELQLVELVRHIIFDPVAELARAGGIHVPILGNSSDTDLQELIHAIRVGQISYADGIFSGTFKAATSRALLDAGARWQGVRGVYSLPSARLPSSILSALVVHRQQSEQLFSAIFSKLDEVQAGLDVALAKRQVSATRTVHETQAGLYASTPVEAEVPALSPESLNVLSQAYQQTLQRPIKDWTTAATERLRRDIQDVAGRGYRADALVGMIRKNFGESRKHANFIARQETSLFQSDFRKQRFSEAGIIEYMWRITRDDRTRASHRILNGKIFFYNHPPVTDPKTGARGNPGQPFGCRCADMPVLRGMRP